MTIRRLYAHEMIKHVCKISHLNSKRLLRKLQKMLGGYFILPHPVGVVVSSCVRDIIGIVVLVMQTQPVLRKHTSRRSSVLKVDRK